MSDLGHGFSCHHVSAVPHSAGHWRTGDGGRVDMNCGRRSGNGAEAELSRLTDGTVLTGCRQWMRPGVVDENRTVSVSNLRFQA